MRHRISFMEDAVAEREQGIAKAKGEGLRAARAAVPDAHRKEPSDALRGSQKPDSPGKPKETHPPHKRTPQRIVNAWLALFLCVLFAAHALLGSIHQANPAFAGRLIWVVWIGVGVVVLHIIMSGVTTYDMWTDTERPASAKKKRHQWLKWITGGLVLACAAAHMYVTLAPGAVPNAVFVLRTLLMIALAGLLAWHIFTSAKSLLKDLMPNVSKRTRTYVRIGVVAFFAIVGAILIIALL